MSDSTPIITLRNRYQLIEPIGQGSMGKVYLAEDSLLGGVQVAVKFLSQTLLNSKMQERFEQEATTCAQLGQKSIHIVRVTDYGTSDDDIPFYVMEYLQGDSLGKLISAQPLAVPRFLGLIRQICLGLQAAHEGIVVKGRRVPIIHRDIKPSNILVTQDPTLGELAKILDFGIAKLMQADSDQTNCFMGTLAYASPEQMNGQELDNRSDIYSLGIMMFQMITGKMPLKAESHTFGGWYKAHLYQEPLTLIQAEPSLKIPKVLDGLVMRCLSKQREERPQTIEEILSILSPLDQRFGTGFKIGQRIGATLAKLPVKQKIDDSGTGTPLPDDQICKLTKWPPNKPIAEIVFTQPLQTSHKKIATLWVMLNQDEVERRLFSTRYNTFICTMSPHPMVLWLTVLYNSKHGPRWLPCYLDLKTAAGQEMAGLLSHTGQYKILFFSVEEPQQCAHVVTCHISEPQCKMLQEWAVTARVHNSVGASNTSKNLLKEELNNTLKPHIQQRLESITYETGADLSG